MIAKKSPKGKTNEVGIGSIYLSKFHATIWSILCSPNAPKQDEFLTSPNSIARTFDVSKCYYGRYQQAKYDVDKFELEIKVVSFTREGKVIEFDALVISSKNTEFSFHMPTKYIPALYLALNHILSRVNVNKIF